MAKKPKFRAVDSHKYLRLGKRDKRKRKYKRPRGGENKIRLNRAGRLRKVKVGFKNKKSERGLIKNMKPVVVHNINDMKKIRENMIGIVAKIGSKKKKEIAEHALKNKVKLLNLNPEKFLDSFEKMQKAKLALKEKHEKAEKEKVEKEKTEKEAKNKIEERKEDSKEEKKEEKPVEKEEKKEGKSEKKLENKINNPEEK